MPRHSKPTADHAASGALSASPSRYASRGADMEPTGELCACPDFLDGVQAQCWSELVSIMPPGVLKNADSWACENICRMQAMIRQGTALPTHFAQVLAYLDRFGMNPKARPSVQVPVKKQTGGFADV